jgi:hypothetical protein
MNCNVPTDICFLLCRLPGAWRRHRRACRRLGNRFLRRSRHARVPRPAAVVCLRRSPNSCAAIRSIRRTSLRTSARRRRAGGAREHPPVHARTLGTLLDFRPQRQLARFFAAARRQLHAGRPDRQRTRVLLAAAELRQRFGSRAPSQAQLFEALHQLTLDLGARGVQLPAVEWRLPVRPLLHQLTYIIRQAPFAVAHLRDQDLSIDFSA